MNIALFALCGLFWQAQPPQKSCVIVNRHQKKFGEAMMRWTEPKPFDFVEGAFPAGMKFHYEIGDKTIREIQAKGGKVVVLRADYVLADLQDAREQCQAFSLAPKTSP